MAKIIESWDDFNLKPEVYQPIGDTPEWNIPTLIQRIAIPEIIERHNLIAQAETGSGKTLAFHPGS